MYKINVYTSCPRLNSVPAKILLKLPTSIGFAENQLRRSVLSFTTPTTVLRRFMQQSPVRTFITLTVVKSPLFGSNIRHFYVIFYVRFNYAQCSRLMLTWWPIMQKVRSFYRTAYKTTIFILFPHGTFRYRLRVIFSLWGRFPFLFKTVFWTILLFRLFYFHSR